MTVLVRRDAQTVRSLLTSAIEVLTKAGFENPEMEARFLLSGLLKKSLTDLYVSQSMILDKETIETFQKMVERRIGKEPAAYILGRTEFMGREFTIDRRGLIPRPETELLVERAIAWLENKRLLNPRILDMGTGSGCVGLLMAERFPKADVTLADLSAEALDLAQCNAKNQSNVVFLRSDLFAEVSTGKQGYFDMILSNPPYVSTSELSMLEPDLSFEPVSALDGGADGLFVVRRLAVEAKYFLRPGGLLMMEIGYRQGDAVQNLLQAAGYNDIEIFKDYQQHDRIIKGEKIGSI